MPSPSIVVGRVLHVGTFKGVVAPILYPLNRIITSHHSSLSVNWILYLVVGTDMPPPQILVTCDVVDRKGSGISFVRHAVVSGA
jgi:hypothetical protein